MTCVVHQVGSRIGEQARAILGRSSEAVVVHSPRVHDVGMGYQQVHRIGSDGGPIWEIIAEIGA